MIRTLLFIICLAGLLYGMFRELPPPQLFQESDKVGHILAFAALTLSGLLCFTRKLSVPFIVVMLSFAAVSEYLQVSFRPQRYFSELDMYANLAGVALVSIIWLIAETCRKGHIDQPIDQD